jgi:hypothetical protein
MENRFIGTGMITHARTVQGITTGVNRVVMVFLTGVGRQVALTGVGCKLSRSQSVNCAPLKVLEKRK